ALALRTLRQFSEQTRLHQLVERRDENPALHRHTPTLARRKAGTTTRLRARRHCSAAPTQLERLGQSVTIEAAAQPPAPSSPQAAAQPPARSSPQTDTLW